MRAKSRLPKQLTGICLISLCTCVLCFWLYNMLAYAFLQALAITALTISFHLASRLLIGLAFQKSCNNQMNFCRPWFRPRPREARLYKILRVKRWKNHMPTFSPETFAFDKQRLSSILGGNLPGGNGASVQYRGQFCAAAVCQMVRRLCRVCCYFGAGRPFGQRVCHSSAVQPRAYMEFAK